MLLYNLSIILSLLLFLWILTVPHIIEKKVVSSGTKDRWGDYTYQYVNKPLGLKIGYLLVAILLSFIPVFNIMISFVGSLVLFFAYFFTEDSKKVFPNKERMFISKIAKFLSYEVKKK